MSGVARPCFWCGLPNFSRGSAPALVADLLESDPEMEWTVRGITARLDLPLTTVHQSLYRLRGAELVQRRITGDRAGLWRWGTPPEVVGA